MSELIDRQEAIDRFNVIRPVDPKKDEYTKGIDVGIAMCIVAVKDQPTIQHENAQLSQEGATSDLISRQAAIDAIHNLYAIHGSEGSWIDQKDAFKALNSLPSAQPEPHEGHWILHESPDGSEQYECSECGVLWEFNDGTPEDNEAYFCPKCGAKMTISK
jgi:DNA-directed RNA polymerase subunit RPC12/RpoP